MLLLLLPLLQAPLARADTGLQGLDYSFSRGQFADLNMRELPAALLAGEPELRSAWYWGLAVAKPLRILPDSAPGHSGWHLDLEGRLLKHTGGQEHIETVAALVLRTPCFSVGLLCLQAGAGDGPSWAWEKPLMEKGAEGILGVNSYQLQNFVLLELAVGSRSGHWQTLLQLHHRSGVFGLISPEGTGSNYLAVGLRWRPGAG